MHAIELSNATVRYKKGHVVGGFSFSAEPGESIAIFGGVGSGKTTALRLLVGALKQDTGIVRVLGRAPRGVRRRVGYVAQGQRANSVFTPHQVLSQAMVRRFVPGGQRASRMAEILELLDLYPHRDQPTRELSYGLQVGVAVAAELIHRPAVLLLDNVTSAMPSPVAERLQAYLGTRRTQHGHTTVFATTVSEEAEEASRVLLLNDGRQCAYARPPELLSQYAKDAITVEAEDLEAVQKTLSGIYNVEVTETVRGLRFASREGVETAARLFRRPTGGVHMVYVQRPTLWDVLEALQTLEQEP